MTTVSCAWIDRFKSRRINVYRPLAGKSRSVNSEAADDWKSDQLLQEIKEYTYTMLVKQIYFLTYNLDKVFLLVETPAIPTYLLTYLLTPRSRVLLEKLNGSQPQFNYNT
jgi:hypothetical protein